MARSRKTRSRNTPAVVALTTLALLVIGGGWIFYRSRQIPNIVVTFPAVPVDNAFNDFTNAEALARALPQNHDYSPAGYATVAKLAGPVMAALRAGLSKPYVCPSTPTRYGATMGNANFRELAKVVEGVAYYYDDIRDPAKATETRLDGLLFAAKVPRGDGLMGGENSQFFRLLFLKRYEADVPRLSAPELARVANRLDRVIAQTVPFADQLEEQMNESTNEALAALRSPDGLNSWQGARNFYPHPDENTFAAGVKQTVKAAGLITGDKAGMLREDYRYGQQLVAAARRPYGAKNPALPKNPMAVYYDLGPFDRRARFVADEAAKEVLRAEVACYRYRLANGRYPEGPADLVPRYLPAVPTDPFGVGAQPLKYRRVDPGTSFLLYSVGPDRNDDGGRPQTDLTNVEPSAGDIVAGHVLGTNYDREIHW